MDCLVDFCGLLLTTDTKFALEPLNQLVLIPLGLLAASAADAVNQKKKKISAWDVQVF